MYDGIVPSFEALLKEFVHDPAGLSHKDRERRRLFLTTYWQKIYNDMSSFGSTNSAIKRTYERVRSKAYKIYITNRANKSPKIQSEEQDFWSEPQKERKSMEAV